MGLGEVMPICGAEEDMTKKSTEASPEEYGGSLFKTLSLTTPSSCALTRLPGWRHVMRCILSCVLIDRHCLQVSGWV